MKTFKEFLTEGLEKFNTVAEHMERATTSLGLASKYPKDHPHHIAHMQHHHFYMGKAAAVAGDEVGIKMHKELLNHWNQKVPSKKYTR